jgi:hypothetical protein
VKSSSPTPDYEKLLSQALAKQRDEYEALLNKQDKSFARAIN